MTRDEVLDVIKLLDAGKNPGRGRVEAVIAFLVDESNRETFIRPPDYVYKGWVLK